MAVVEGLEKVVAALRSKAAKLTGNETEPSVIVGYTQNYAVFVHENLEAHHHVGEAKFLERPARELSPELGKIVAQALAKGLNIAQALVLAGLRLQRESQLLVPVATGALKGSAFTQLESAGKQSEPLAG